MNYNLTLKQIKKTNFRELYKKFLVEKNLSSKELETLLAISVCFINSDNIDVQRFGYKIILEYCNENKNYGPLYEVSINCGLFPVSKYIEDHFIPKERRNFFIEWNSSFLEQYKWKGIYQSKQQQLLRDFYSNKKSQSVAVIAPTSYGKSELILSSIQDYAGKKICILTSTKALLTQTKRRIRSSNNEIFKKIIVHSDMYNPKETSCLAILTQERLLRLFKRDRKLAFDCLIVDEAHEILENNNRSHTLANVIIVAQKRNRNVAIKFLTPFLESAQSLKLRHTNYVLADFKVNEYIKVENYFLYDLRNEGGLFRYDQFLNEYFHIPLNVLFDTEESFVKSHATEKNIIYINKPRNIEDFALKLSEILSPVKSDQIDRACKQLSDYLHPKYNLLTCLKKGVVYHHGSVPDAIKSYIENLYSNCPEVKYIVTSSTLLSGVNIPAYSMFILDSRRGQSNLTYDSFKNLTGRVCRFNDIFDKESGGLERLEPKIYLVFGKYFSQKANAQNFLSNVAKIGLKNKDRVENVLLENSSLNPENQVTLNKVEEFIENYEEGVVTDYKARHTQTDIGHACIMNGVTEIDVFQNELLMQKVLDECAPSIGKISDLSKLLDLIGRIFIQNIPHGKYASISRLEKLAAQNFYAMFLAWREQNKSYSQLIALFIKYWMKLLESDPEAMVYVGKWGDTKGSSGVGNFYTKISGKTPTFLINLAIVRIKEEQDFIDNILMKFIEVLFDLEILDETFYNKIKYGTDNRDVICLLKNGFSLSVAQLLYKKYSKYFKIDSETETVLFDGELVNKMVDGKENEIVIFETQSCI